MSFRQHIEHVVPKALFEDTRSCPRGIGAYLFLVTSGTQSIGGIARGIDAHRHSVSPLLAHLESTGWVSDISTPRSRMRKFVATWPIRVESEIANLIERDRWNVTRAGEWLMTCWLDYLVASSNYLDHSRPSWLLNWPTGSRMEFDREYRELGVAFEFQGEQHFEATDMFPNEEDLTQQKTRDYMKAGISFYNDMQLVPVTAHDLTLRGMVGKVSGLPLRHYRPKGPIAKTLMQIGESYISYWEKRRRQRSS
jgi:hypothetical protein